METPEDLNIPISYHTLLRAAISEEMAEYAASVLKDDSAKRLFYIDRMIVDICKHKSFNFDLLKIHDIVVIKGVLYQVIKENFETVDIESLTPEQFKSEISKNAFVQIIK